MHSIERILYVTVVQGLLNGTELILFPLESHFSLARLPSPLFSISVLNCRMPHAVSWLCEVERQLMCAEPGKVVFSGNQGYRVRLIEMLLLCGHIVDVCECFYFF